MNPVVERATSVGGYWKECASKGGWLYVKERVRA